MRLAGYDYAQPRAYFVTICTEGRLRLLGQIDDGQLHCNELGDIVTECWFDLPRHYSHVALDAFVVMPNHIHGIIVLRGYDEDASNEPVHDAVGAGLRPARPPETTVPVDQPGRAGLRPARPPETTVPVDQPGRAGLGPARPPETTVPVDQPGRAGLRPAPTTNAAANDDESADESLNESADQSVGAGLRPARPPETTVPVDQPGRAGLRPAPTTNAAANDIEIKRHALPEIVRAFKSFSARRINVSRNAPAAPVWQRNYYEHIVRTEPELARVRAYIQDNPARWTLDPYYAAHEMAH